MYHVTKREVRHGLYFLFRVPRSVFFNAKHNASRSIPQNIREVMNPQRPVCILPVNNVQAGIIPGTLIAYFTPAQTLGYQGIGMAVAEKGGLQNPKGGIGIEIE